MKTLPCLFLLAALASAQSHAAKPPRPLPPGLYATFTTSKGVFTAQLFEKEVPNTVRNFVELAQGTKATRDPKTGAMVKRRLYDGIIFHRVVPGEMIQAGDPTGTGTHDCGVTIRDEFLPGLMFDRSGKLAMANTGSPDSGGCQFFITDGPMSRWNNKYAIFGKVVEGEDVVVKINRARVRYEKPLEPVKLLSVTISRREK